MSSPDLRGESCLTPRRAGVLLADTVNQDNPQGDHPGPRPANVSAPRVVQPSTPDPDRRGETSRAGGPAPVKSVLLVCAVIVGLRRVDFRAWCSRGLPHPPRASPWSNGAGGAAQALFSVYRGGERRRSRTSVRRADVYYPAQVKLAPAATANAGDGIRPRHDCCAALAAPLLDPGHPVPSDEPHPAVFDRQSGALSRNPIPYKSLRAIGLTRKPVTHGDSGIIPL